MSIGKRNRGVRRLVLLCILLLAAFLRFWRLEEMPPGLYHDEAYNGLDALSLLDGKTFPQFYEGWELYAQDAHIDNPPQDTRFPVFFEGNYGREPLHIYLMALSIRIFGPNPYAIRVVPALAGVVAVFTTFLAATVFLNNSQTPNYNPKFTLNLPFIAAFALAVMFPAVHFSRFGLRVMLFLPVETLTVYFFWRGISAKEGGNKATAAWFALAGGMLGLGLYVYAAGRLFPLLFVLFVPFWFWLDRGAFSRYWRAVLLMAGAAALTAVPLLLFFARYPYFFFFRIAFVANKGKGTVTGKPWLTWLLNVGRVVGGLIWRGEMHLRHNLPGRPFLDPVQAILFIIGLGQIIKTRVNSRRLFLGLWLIIMLLPSILSGDAPHFGRLVGVAPPLAILVAIGLGKLEDWIHSRLRPLVNRIEGYPRQLLLISPEWLLLTFLLISGISTVRDYFSRYAAEPNLAHDFYQADWRLGQFAADQPADTFLYLIPTQEEMATIYFALGGETDRLRSFSSSGKLWPLGGESGEWLYMIRPSAANRLAGMPGAKLDLNLVSEQDNFIPVPADAASRPYPQRSMDVSWANQIRLLGWSRWQDDESLHVSLFWQALQAPDKDYTGFVHLVDEGGRLLSQKDRPPDGFPTSDWRPGEIVMDTYEVPLPLDDPFGEYRLQTGFYYLPTMESLGPAVSLGTQDIH